MQMLCCCGSRRNGQDLDVGSRNDKPLCSLTSANLLTISTKRLRLSRAKADNDPDPDLTSDQVSPFEGPIELCQLASNGNQATEASSDVPAIPKASTFGAVKVRFSKQLFHETSLRRQSRVSIGHSDEELARRAEVRRLRQQRIKDELDKDCCDDGCSDDSRGSTHYISPLIDIGSPGIGPRDTIEFTFESCCAGSNSTVSEPSFCLIPSSLADAKNESSQENALIDLESSTKLLAAEPSGTITSQARSQSAEGSPSVRCISPVTIPQRPSSCAPSTTTLNRILGLDNEFNIRHGSHAWDDQSALGIWLIAQGMRSNDSSALHSDKCDVTCAATTDRNSLQPPVDLGGVDRINDSSNSETCNLNTKADSESKSSAPKRQSHHCSAQSPNAACRSSDDHKDKPDHPSTPRSSHSHNAHKSTAADQNENGSSTYPSVLPSFEPSPTPSQKEGYILSQKDLENLDFSSFQWYANLSLMRNLGCSEGKSSYATAEEHSPATSKSCDLYTPNKSTIKPSQIKGDDSIPSLSTNFEGRQAPNQRSNDNLQQASESKDAQLSRYLDEPVPSVPQHTSFRTRIQQSLSNLSKSSSIVSNKKGSNEDSSLIKDFQLPILGSTIDIDGRLPERSN